MYVVIENHTIKIGASIGIACYPSSGPDHLTLIKNADMAMYRAKKLGRNNCQFFTDEVNKAYLRRLYLEASLQQAFKRHEFNVVYQPIVNLQTQKIIGFEALLRWTNPTFNEIFPTEFIPIIEDAGMMLDLSRWLFCQVCVQYNHWRKTHTNLFINLNISEYQLLHADFASSITSICHHHGVNPNVIGLEITETTIMSQPIYATQRIKQLHQYGFKLYLDNFGTGYSSLKQIQHLPFDTLKIDKSFTQGLPLNTSNAIIVKSIIGFAHSLNLSIVAEGIETEDQAKFFQDNHCDIAQGFYFSKPKNAKQANQLLTPKYLKTLFHQTSNSHHQRPTH